MKFQKIKVCLKKNLFFLKRKSCRKKKKAKSKVLLHRKPINITQLKMTDEKGGKREKNLKYLREIIKCYQKYHQLIKVEWGDNLEG